MTLLPASLHKHQGLRFTSQPLPTANTPTYPETYQPPCERWITENERKDEGMNVVQDLYITFLFLRVVEWALLSWLAVPEDGRVVLSSIHVLLMVKDIPSKYNEKDQTMGNIHNGTRELDAKRNWMELHKRLDSFLLRVFNPFVTAKNIPRQDRENKMTG